MADAVNAGQADDAPTSSRTRSGARARPSGESTSSTVNSTPPLINDTNKVIQPVTVKSDEELQSERIRKELKETKRRNEMKKMRNDLEGSNSKYEEAMSRISDKMKKREKEEKVERIREDANRIMEEEIKKLEDEATEVVDEYDTRFEEEYQTMIENKMDVDEATKIKEENMKSVNESMQVAVTKRFEWIREKAIKMIEKESKKIELEYASVQEREQTEVRRLQEIQAKTQQEEDKSEHELQKCILTAEDQQKMWDQAKEARMVKEKEERDAIEMHKKEIEECEKRLEALANEELVGDFELRAAKDAESAAREDAEQKRAARRQATRDVDLHPCNQAACFSRACTICTNTNPRERVTLVVCGHVVCTICAEEMAEKQGQSDAETVDCPFCRKRTKFVKIFEDCEAPVVRKRANDGQDEALPVKKAKEYP